MERRALQASIAILALLPVSAGLAGVVFGPSFLGVVDDRPADLDSHLRFLSGVFLAFGIAWWTCIPAIERKTARFRLLGLCTIAGGFARVYSLLLAGTPSTGHLIGLGMELLIVPLLLLWQARVARQGRRAG